MKAITYNQYGNSEVLKLSDIPKPEPKDNQILIKMMATTVNSADVRLRKADPFLIRFAFGLFNPKKKVLGTVISGIVETIGNEVTKFKVGDQVFGLNDLTMGTYAEFLLVPETIPLAMKPNNINFEEAAAIVFGGHTALHFLKKANITKGQKVLIYGASGSVGTSAVQLAKYYGAEVTAICSQSNIQMLKNLGADHIIDYNTTDLSTLNKDFDVVFETVNKTKVETIAQLTRTNGVLILGAVIIKGLIQGMWIAKKRKLKLIAGVAEVNSDDLKFIGRLIENKHLEPVIDKTYPLEQIRLAHQYVDLGHKKGNIVITL
jgi:NADPH:quinone reductase-like Zn-dependent oxidoreductase